MKTFSDLGTFLLGNLCNGYRGFNAILILQEYTGMSFMIICMYILLFKIILNYILTKDNVIHCSASQLQDHPLLRTPGPRNIISCPEPHTRNGLSKGFIPGLSHELK